MKRSPGWWVVALLMSTVGGCGTVGPPIPPEDVGIGPLIERQKKLQGQQAGPQQSTLDSMQTESPELLEPVGQDQELPSLRPVGGR